MGGRFEMNLLLLREIWKSGSERRDWKRRMGRRSCVERKRTSVPVGGENEKQTRKTRRR